jgi:hypothetical protein
MAWMARVQFLVGAGVKQLGCEADHSPLSIAKVKNMQIYTSTPHISSEVFS